MRVLYGAAIFLGALLLFLVEPIAAKELVPELGGSSSVWLASLCFFQVGLLAGYAYADRITAWSSGWSGKAGFVQRSGTGLATLHGLLLMLALASLLAAKHGAAVGGGTLHPMVAVFTTLALRVGLPFVLLGATTPLLQLTMARRLGGPVPYRLFALSNAGSLLALLLYPSLVEPFLTMRTQRALWTGGFAIYALLCGWLVWQGLGHPSAATRPQASAALGFEATEEETEPAGLSRNLSEERSRKWLWFGLAAAGTMQLTAVTGHLTENVAALPLLWVVPLLAYLLSLVLAFEFPKAFHRGLLVRLLVVMLASLGYLLSKTDVSVPIGISIGFFLLELFVACWFCHAELHRLRPRQVRAAGGFYLWLAAGGAAGTALIAVVSPSVFRANYDLPLAFAATAAMALWSTWQDGAAQRVLWSVCTAGCLLLAGALHNTYAHQSLLNLRNFYGSLRVKQTLTPPQAGTSRVLLHGTIQHGMQWFSPEFRREPLTYYEADSGIGLVMRLCCEGRPRRVGVIGLGTGTMAAYGRPGDVMRFYEINPLVNRVATTLFTYTRESPAAIEMVPGDARISMHRERPEAYDVLVVDAFSGDAIPVHLLTVEAMQEYRRHLRPGGVIAFHISNQYLDLQPVVSALARASGWEARVVNSPKQDARGEFSARWVLVGEESGLLGNDELALSSERLQRDPGFEAWTDDYSSLLRIVRWGGHDR